EIDRHPVALEVGIDEAFRVGRVDEAQVVPTRAGPLWHRVRLAARRLAGGRIRCVHPLRDLCERALPSARGPAVRAIAQYDGQHLLGNRTRLAVDPDDRERLAPVTLAREQ